MGFCFVKFLKKKPVVVEHLRLGKSVLNENDEREVERIHSDVPRTDLHFFVCTL